MNSADVNHSCRPGVYLLAAAGVLLGCMAAASPEWRWVLLAAGFLFGVLTIRRFGWLVWLFFAAAYLSGSVTQEARKAALPPCYGTAEVRLTDARLNGVPGLPQPAAVQGELLSFAPYGEAMRPASCEKVQIFLPKDAPVPAYGSRLTVTGRMLPPEGGYFLWEEGKRTFFEDGYAGFQRSRGIAAVISVDRVESLQPPRATPLSWLYRCRDGIVTRLLSGVRDPGLRGTSAALTFGLTGGVKGELRRQYVDAGTVHLFSVSGMHVMLLAGLLAFLCRGVPFQARNFLVAGGCFVYAAATGFNTPALRAFLLVGAWCVLRSKLCFVPVLSLLLAVGSLLLLLQPQLLTDAGFQYTFLITAALLLYSRRARERRLEEEEAFSWMAEGPVRRRAMAAARRKRFFVQAAGAAFTAFLAALPITLRLQGEVPPGSLAANFLLVLLLPIIFPALLLKLLLGGCAAGVLLLELPFRLLNALTGVTQEGFSRLSGMAPPVWLLVAYELFLFTALALPRNPSKRALIPAGALGGILLYLFAAPHFRPPFLLTAHTGSAAPPQCAFCDPVSGRRVVCLSPGMEAARALGRELKRRGVNRVETLYLAGNSKSSRYALQSFSRLVAVQRCEVVSRGKEAPGAHFFLKKSGFAFEYPGNPCTVKSRLSCECTSGGWRFRSSGSSSEEVLPFTSVPEVRCYEY